MGKCPIIGSVLYVVHTTNACIMAASYYHKDPSEIIKAIVLMTVLVRQAFQTMDMPIREGSNSFAKSTMQNFGTFQKLSKVLSKNLGHRPS